jgi:hypothetical protein
MTPRQSFSLLRQFGVSEVTLFMVVPSPGDVIYGPFSDRDEALEFAADADGSLFECRARVIGAKEI